MNSSRLKTATRIILFICGLALIIVLIVPMWRIELSAPQYPEGLLLLIFANRLGGNVDIINGLNHYIGMKTLHTNDFIEFTALPIIITFFAAACILIALNGKRKWLNILFVLFVSFGIIAMIDFWKWEYNYGHNLNPDAAIIVPGMAYQPPLIGFKQLLNFGAYSVPDIGGWLFVGVGALLLLMVIAEWRIYRRIKRSYLNEKLVMTTISFVFIFSCTSSPRAIKIGKDNCAFCKMTISDNRFGGEIITSKSKVYKFDDAHCILAFIKSKEVQKEDLGTVYLTDFTGQHTLIKANDAYLLQSDSLRAPMNGNIAATANQDSIKKMASQYDGSIITWKQLNK